MGVNQYFVRYFLKRYPEQHYSEPIEASQMDTAEKSLIQILEVILKNHQYQGYHLSDIVIEVLTRLN
jgi:hypothetical protein